MEPKEIVPLNHIRIALFDQARQMFKRGALRLLDIFWIDNDQLFPAGVVRKRNAHDMINWIEISGLGYRIGEGENFELHPLQLLKRQILEECPTGRREVVMHWISESEVIPSPFLKAVTECSLFF